MSDSSRFVTQDGVIPPGAADVEASRSPRQSGGGSGGGSGGIGLQKGPHLGFGGKVGIGYGAGFSFKK